ncbi:MAG TPA: superoxide dismutase family protein [Noviherbaspirillum sp.]|uniref:superoxide dismutase family protein n=1 Tax=Noviherbaspirillum sp. TaxID=1926288 RepID=UPI002F9227FB
MRLLTPLLLGSAVLAGCATTSEPTPIAIASLSPTQGNTTNGTVSFVQKGNQILVDARVDGLTPGPHGFHVHEKGDCSAPDATSAGGHFNPGNRPHGGPSHAEHHAGDFGNLVADASGKASLQLSVPASEISLAQGAPNSIIGKGLIVHADPDDYKTQPTGNAGKRLACAVIRLR